MTFSDPYAKLCFTTMIMRALTDLTQGKEKSTTSEYFTWMEILALRLI
jgi:hypothetical protein